MKGRTVLVLLVVVFVGWNLLLGASVKSSGTHAGKVALLVFLSLTHLRLLVVLLCTFVQVIPVLFRSLAFGSKTKVYCFSSSYLMSVLGPMMDLFFFFF
jgi:hypothetical protein